MSVKMISYGTWVNLGAGEIDVETHVAVALGEFAHEYDVPALIDAYHNAINDALAARRLGVVLCGSEFYGDAVRLTADMRNTIRHIVNGIGFWQLAAVQELPALAAQTV